MPSKDQSLKDRLDGNELDLSMSSLTKIPIKDLAALPKATVIDFSCNELTSLPDTFCTLKHLVKIDLSKNNLTELPQKIGNLEKLQHLDLLGNQIKTLPMSFFKLKNLKWLDLKDNPLNEQLKKIAGDCLDDKQCKECAREVVGYMRVVQSEHERVKQIRLKEEREREAAKAAEENKQREQKKKQKQAEKDRKRKEYEARQAALKEEELQAQQNVEEDEGIQKQNSYQTEPMKPLTVSPCYIMFLFTFMVAIVAVLVGGFFYCQQHGNIPACHDINFRADQVTRTFHYFFAK